MAHEGLYRALGASVRELNTILTEQQTWDANQEFKAAQAERDDKILQSQLQDNAMRRKGLALQAQQAEALMAPVSVQGLIPKEEATPWLYKKNANGDSGIDVINAYLSEDGKYAYDEKNNVWRDQGGGVRTVPTWRFKEMASEVGGLMAAHTDSLKLLQDGVNKSAKGIVEIDKQIRALDKEKGQEPRLQAILGKKQAQLKMAKDELANVGAQFSTMMEDPIALLNNKGAQLEQVRAMMAMQGADTDNIDYLINRNDKKIANLQALEETRIAREAKNSSGATKILYNKQDPTKTMSVKITDKMLNADGQYIPPEGWTLNKPGTGSTERMTTRSSTLDRDIRQQVLKSTDLETIKPSKQAEADIKVAKAQELLAKYGDKATNNDIKILAREYYDQIDQQYRTDLQKANKKYSKKLLKEKVDELKAFYLKEYGYKPTIKLK